MNYGIFLNFSDYLNRWKLDTIVNVVSLVKSYVESHHIKDVELCSVEDNTWSGDNDRYDVEIRYADSKGDIIQQKLLILRGEILDSKEFHSRYEEFYQRKEVLA